MQRMYKLFMLTGFLVTMMVISILFSGCAVMRPTDPYAPVSPLPLRRAAGTESVPPDDALQGALTLERAIELALAGNPEIVATQWDVVATGAKLDAVRANRLPTLSAEGGYQNSLDGQRLIPARYDGEQGIFDREAYRSDLILKLPLFTGGRISNEISAASLLRQSEEHRLARTREELVFNVSSTFYAMLGQREVIRSLEFSASVMEEHRRQIENLLAAQKAARVDLLRTEVRLADLRQNLVKERNILTIEKRLLANLLGMDNDPERFEIEGNLVFEEVSALDLENHLTAALLNRGDYLAAKTRLESQARQVDAAIAGHWPTISLVGSYGARVAGTGESEDVGTVGVGVVVPLFEGGRTTALINQERAALGAARERLRRLELQIRLEVETSLLDIRSSSERIQASRQAVEQARESLRIERLKYELASGSMTDVLDVQAALLQAETSYARALADFNIASARLKLASGGNIL